MLQESWTDVKCKSTYSGSSRWKFLSSVVLLRVSFVCAVIVAATCSSSVRKHHVAVPAALEGICSLMDVRSYRDSSKERRVGSQPDGL